MLTAFFIAISTIKIMLVYGGVGYDFIPID